MKQTASIPKISSYSTSIPDPNKPNHLSLSDPRKRYIHDKTYQALLLIPLIDNKFTNSLTTILCKYDLLIKLMATPPPKSKKFLYATASGLFTTKYPAIFFHQPKQEGVVPRMSCTLFSERSSLERRDVSYMNGSTSTFLIIRLLVRTSTIPWQNLT
ncbi:hypothetical protein AB6A40_010748 [Gnathostoma spinigerum]|uniref:Uncharacterized protein n=1 Tax=Gnathostoma spinigerum TaxID=75299 RepID=A0ABD6F0F2_9BILA